MKENIEKLLKTIHFECKEVGIRELYKSLSDVCLNQHKKKISESTFQNKINIEIDSHKLNIEEFMYILFFLQKKIITLLY